MISRSDGAEAAGPVWRALPAGLALIFALAAPWSIAAAQSAVVLAALVVLAGALTRRLPFPRIPWTLGLILLFLGFQALSIPLGVHPARSLSCFKGSWALLFPFVFWSLLQSPAVRRRSLIALAASTALAGIYGTIQHFQGYDWLHEKVLENYGGGGYVAVGNLSSHLTYAGVLLPVLFLGLGLAMDRRLRLFSWPAFFLIGAGILFSFTRTAWAGAAGGLMVLGALRGRRPFLILAGSIAVLTLGAAVAEPALRDRLLTFLDIADDPRVRLWQTALRIIADHPLLGAGLGSYKTQFFVYKVPGEYMSTVHPHCDLLNHAVETGILGGLAWIGIWIAFFLETRHEGRAWLPDALRAGVAGLLVAGLGQCYSTDEEVAQVWYFLLAAALHETRRPAFGPSGKAGSMPGAGSAPGPEPGTTLQDPLRRPEGLMPRRRSLWRRLERGFKSRSLPMAVSILTPGRAAGRPLGKADWKRVLVVRPDNRLGNLILLTPFLQRLRQALPDSRIGLLCGEEYAPLLEPWPWLDQRIVQPKRRHAQMPFLFPPWLAAVRRRGWDLAFEMSNQDTHSYYSCLMTAASGAPERVGFGHPRSLPALSRWVRSEDPNLHYSLAPLLLLRELDLPAEAAPMRCPLEAEASEPFRAWWKREGLEDGRYLLLHLGGRSAKAWPMDGWAALLPEAARCERAVVVAGPDEQDRLRKLTAGAAGALWTAAPPLNLQDLGHLLRGSAAYVGCDSGVMHFAVAVGAPTLALFFRSNPFAYAPLGAAHATVLLADPYGVHDEEWNRPVLDMPRSVLIRADSPPELSRQGIPETGQRALDAILRALHAVLDSRTAAAGRSGSAQANLHDPVDRQAGGSASGDHQAQPKDERGSEPGDPPGFRKDAR